MKIKKNRFDFLQSKDSMLSKLLQKVNRVMEGIVDAKPYILDWGHVLSEYDKLGVGDVAEFASSYSFGWHALNGKLDDTVSKQAMYLEIINGITSQRDNVK